MKKVIKWTNSTSQHPGGVCEAAVALWLQRIAQSGIGNANQLTSIDCDALQAKAENGSFTYALHLLPMLNNSPSFDISNSHSIGGNFSSQVNTLSSGEFFYMSVNNGKTGSGLRSHALGIYRSGTHFHFFDPDRGIFNYAISELSALMGQINVSLANYSEKGFTKGKI